jgi:transcriptional regulator with XRE-family HTH domain
LERLLELRKERGLSRARLGAMAGVDPATIFVLEKGQRPPRITTLEKLANALEVDPAYLLEDVVSTPKAEIPSLVEEMLVGRIGSKYLLKTPKETYTEAMRTTIVGIDNWLTSLREEVEYIKSIDLDDYPDEIKDDPAMRRDFRGYLRRLRSGYLVRALNLIEAAATKMEHSPELSEEWEDRMEDQRSLAMKAA